MRKTMTPAELYKHNQKKAKVITRLTPIIFWVCLAISVLFMVYAFKNSIGNILEIFDFLNKDKYNGVELEQNYAYLVEKYGEITIGGSKGGFAITFVNVKRALFSGMGILCFEMAIVFFALAFILAKWLLPKWSKSIIENNQDMVNMKVLEKE